MERFEAHCSSFKAASQSCISPEVNSTSGIYAYKSTSDALENLDRCSYRGTFLGRVSLWGVIQKHQFGYRAQFAYPVSQFGYRAQFAYPVSLVFGICCVCKRIVNLKSEPFAIGWASLHITEAFSVSGFLCEDCNGRYYSVDIESSHRELSALTERYGISIE